MKFAGQRGVSRDCGCLKKCIRNNCFIAGGLRTATHCSFFGHGKLSAGNFLGVPTIKFGCFFADYGLGLRTVCRFVKHAKRSARLSHSGSSLKLTVRSKAILLRCAFWSWHRRGEDLFVRLQTVTLFLSYRLLQQ